MLVNILSNIGHKSYNFSQLMEHIKFILIMFCKDTLVYKSIDASHFWSFIIFPIFHSPIRFFNPSHSNYSLLSRIIYILRNAMRRHSQTIPGRAWLSSLVRGISRPPSHIYKRTAPSEPYLENHGASNEKKRQWYKI